jgi:hypothetical protein
MLSKKRADGGHLHRLINKDIAIFVRLFTSM